MYSCSTSKRWSSGTETFKGLPLAQTSIPSSTNCPSSRSHHVREMEISLLVLSWSTISMDISVSPSAKALCENDSSMKR